MPHLDLRLLGPLQVMIDGKAITSFESSRVRALLCLLAAEAPRPQFRESLAEMLWPGWPQQSAMTNLRSALADLRKNLGDREAHPPFLHISRESIQLNLESEVWVDTTEFLRSRDVNVYRGLFLEGFGLADSPAFTEWQQSKRAYYQQQVLAELAKQAERCEQVGQFEQGLEYARRQLEIEPWLEEAHRQMMRLLARSGKRSMALAQYETCRQLLEKELGAVPSEETRQLSEHIRQGEWPGGRAQVSEKPRSALPTGTVTFLFTDIQNSTSLWEQHPDAMAAALKVHNDVLRQANEKYGGIVFKVVGDAFQVVFPTALQALKGAIQGQSALETGPWSEIGPLRVRMGLHTGEAELDLGGDEYTASHAKNRVSRVMSAAHAGQILLSGETAELVNRQLPPEVWLKDLGEHRLRGLALQEHLFQVCAPGLVQDFPPLASGIAQPNNLPIQMTSFIGREREIAGVTGLLETHRLVTLTGSGGTGKTRLALWAAEELLDRYPNGAWLVELAPLADPMMVPQAVMGALGLTEESGKTPTRQLTDYLREKKLLLILDNCEHLVEACTELTDNLLHSAPRLTILATSREILRLAGEVPYRVPPLSMPDPRQTLPLEELAQFEAVQLFVERARVVSPEFTLTPDNATAVAQITQRLDGIPLAIELAAARLRQLSAGQIVQRLNDAFRLLTGGARTALPRHQTLTALIDWSYNLLSNAERRLLRSLSAFAGGWTLEAAEEVCAEGRDVLDLLRGLADKSLILAEPAPGGEMRYRMLETVRQYAHTRLVEAGEAEAVRTRHLAYYLRLAERLEPNLLGKDQIATLNYWEGELNNLRLALEWALQVDVEAELRLAAALRWFWHIRCYWLEAISWLEQGLAAEALNRGGRPLAGSPAMIRAKALTALGQLKWRRDFFFAAGAKLPLEEALALYRASGPENHDGLAWALVFLSHCALCDGDLGKTRILAEEALGLFREAGDPRGMIDSLLVLGGIESDRVFQKQIHRELLAIAQSAGDTDGIGLGLGLIGWDELEDGEYEGSLVALAASMENARRVGNPEAGAGYARILGSAYLLNGDLERAVLYLEEALANFREITNEVEVAICLFWKCLIAFTQGNDDQAADLCEEVRRIAQKTGDLQTAYRSFYLQARLARLRGDAAAARSYAEEGLNARSDCEEQVMWVRVELGYLALQDGDLEQARAHFTEGLRVTVDLGGASLVGWLLDGLAVLSAREGKMERAARLFGSRYWRGFAHTLSPIERVERDADFAEITAILGQERFEQLCEEGSSLTFEQLVALAQGEG